MTRQQQFDDPALTAIVNAKGEDPSEERSVVYKSDLRLHKFLASVPARKHLDHGVITTLSLQFTCSDSNGL